MSTNSLAITFSNRQVVSDTYWLRMELVEEDDQMTVGEAADIIDALYDVSVCGQEGAESEPDELPVKEAWDRALVFFDQANNLPTCEALEAMDAGDSGAYEVDIKVWRSHPQNELYKLILSNGSAGQPRRIEERVTVTLDIGDQFTRIFGDEEKLFIASGIDDKFSVTLDMPIIGNPVATWQDIDGPDIHIKGNTLWWKGLTNGIIRAEFDTVYDLIHIKVTGITNTVSSIIEGTVESQWLGTGWYSGSETGEELTDVQDTECSVLAFYHYQYEELILHKPEIDESISETDAAAICYQIGAVHRGTDGTGTSDDDPSGKICYKRVSSTAICTCGGDEQEVIVLEPIPCPFGYTAGSIVQGDEYAEEGGDKYIDCGHDGEVHNPEFYEETCCEPWPFGDTPLPYCEVNYALFLGQSLTEEQTQEIKQAWGEHANIISVGPVDGACGQIITTQEVNQLQCCDGVTELVWDSENSVEILAPSSSGLIYFTGGRVPAEVSVRGSGFWLDGAYTIRDGEVGGSPFRVYADSNACGMCDITIADGCSDVKGEIVCTEGRWGPRENISPEQCPVTGRFTYWGNATWPFKIEGNGVILYIKADVWHYNGNCQAGFVITVRHCKDCVWSLPCTQCYVPPNWFECIPNVDGGTYYEQACAAQSPQYPSCATSGQYSWDYPATWKSDVFYTGVLCDTDQRPGATMAINEVYAKAMQRWIC